MQQCFIEAYAKINITLDVLRKRDDGYHDLCMIMQTVDLCDTLSIRTGCGGNEIQVQTNLSYIPTDNKNLAVKAAWDFLNFCKMQSDGINISIQKRIPVAAGLAGGSSNAAAVIVALNRLYETGLTMDELCTIGAKTGSDVPFCIRGGTLLAEGVGEKLTDLPSMPECFVVLCKPNFGMSTAKVFAKVNCDKINLHPDTEGVIRALQAGDLPGIGQRMYNVLENIVAEEHGVITKIKNDLLNEGALGAIMSGSGSTTFGIFDEKEKAKISYEKLKEKYTDTFLTKISNKV